MMSHKAGYATAAVTAVLGLVALLLTLLFVPTNNAQRQLQQGMTHLRSYMDRQAALERSVVALQRDISRTAPLAYGDLGLGLQIAEVSRTVDSALMVSATVPAGTTGDYSFFINNDTPITVDVGFTPLVGGTAPSYMLTVYGPNGSSLLQQTATAGATFTVPSQYNAWADPWTSGAYGTYRLTLMAQDGDATVDASIACLTQRTVSLSLDGTSRLYSLVVTNNGMNQKNTVTYQGGQ